MQFDVLCRELARGALIWRELLANIPEAEAQTKPNPQSWSILEVACHLLDEEREDFRQRLDIILHRPAEEWPPISPVDWVTARRYSERDFGVVPLSWPNAGRWPGCEPGRRTWTPNTARLWAS